MSVSLVDTYLLQMLSSLMKYGKLALPYRMHYLLYSMRRYIVMAIGRSEFRLRESYQLLTSCQAGVRDSKLYGIASSCVSL